MRNVIFAINITLDGCCDHTKGIADDELLEHYTQLLLDVDLLVYGRENVSTDGCVLAGYREKQFGDKSRDRVCPRI